MDQETAIQVVLAELRRLERQAVAVSAAAPLPMPPPLPPLLPMPPPLLPMPPSLPPMPPSLPPRLVGDPDILAARGYDAFMAGASYGVPLNIDTVVLTKPRSPLAGDYLAPKRARLDYAERSRPPVPPPTIGSAGADAMSVHQAIEAMLGATPWTGRRPNGGIAAPTSSRRRAASSCGAWRGTSARSTSSRPRRWRAS